MQPPNETDRQEVVGNNREHVINIFMTYRPAAQPLTFHFPFYRLPTYCPDVQAVAHYPDIEYSSYKHRLLPPLSGFIITLWHTSLFSTPFRCFIFFSHQVQTFNSFQVWNFHHLERKLEATNYQLQPINHGRACSHHPRLPAFSSRRPCRSTSSIYWASYWELIYCVREFRLVISTIYERRMAIALAPFIIPTALSLFPCRELKPHQPWTNQP